MYSTSEEKFRPTPHAVPHQVKRPKHSCRLQLNGLNPHPSETFPKINCQQYYPSYCRQVKNRQIHNQPDPDNVIVNLGPRGDIEVSEIHGRDLVKKNYAWNRLPPLQQPINNNVPTYIRKQAWE